MRTTLRCLLATVVLIVVGAPVYSAAPASAQTPATEAAETPFEVVQIWACEMNEGTTEAQVQSIAQDWLKALRQMPGGAAVKVRVFFPVVVNKTAGTDFYFVLNAPTFADWGKIWDAYKDDSPAAKSDDLNQGKVDCPDSMLWEAHAIEAK
jgi:hypothetical protein